MRLRSWFSQPVLDKLGEIMSTLEEVLADSAILKTALAGLIDMVRALQAGGTLTAEQQAAVDQLDADLKQDVADIEAAENPPTP